MSAPRQPKLNAGNLSQRELKRASELIRRANNLTVQAPLRLTQGPSGYHFQLDESANWFLARLTSVYTLSDADVSAGGGYPGMTAGTNLYGFIEQAFDAATGWPIDALNGRQTLFSAQGTPQSAFALEVNNALATPGACVEMRLKGVVGGGVPVYEFAGRFSSAWVQVTAAAPGMIYVGRQVSDGVLNGTTTLTSSQANFTAADVDATLIGTGIQAGTVIQSVTDNSTVIMSKTAAQSATNVQVGIVNSVMMGYQAQVLTWELQPPPTNSIIQDWQFTATGTASAWLLSPNSPDPANPFTLPPHDQFPLALLNNPFLCQQASSDYQGYPIYMWPYDPSAFYDTVPERFQGQLGNTGMTQYGHPGAQGNRLSMGPAFTLFGYLNDQAQAYGPTLYVAPAASNYQVAPQPYLCDTGMDSQGNQFVSGLNVAIGGGQVSISGGSDW